VDRLESRHLAPVYVYLVNKIMPASAAIAGAALRFFYSLNVQTKRLAARKLNNELRRIRPVRLECRVSGHFTRFKQPIE
jgi:hypothetical protein